MTVYKSKSIFFGYDKAALVLPIDFGGYLPSEPNKVTRLINRDCYWTVIAVCACGSIVRGSVSMSECKSKLLFCPERAIRREILK